MRRVTVIKRYLAGGQEIVDLEERWTGEVKDEDERSLTIGSKYGTMTFAKSQIDELVEEE
jgi:hypothetical protein